MTWTILNPKYNINHLGLLPEIFQPNDPRSAIDQINERYAHGGGFKSIAKFKLIDADRFIIKYPGDPEIKPIAKLQLSETEEVYVYPHAFVGIHTSPPKAEDGVAVGAHEFSVCRMD